jgi:hypothetical protein
MANWKFLLANSSNLQVTKDITYESRGKNLTLAHNKSGSCGFNLPLSSENFDLTKPNQKCVLAMKNGEVIWSGPIWTRAINFNESKIEVNAVGWFEILMSRFFTTVVPEYAANSNEGAIVMNNSAPIGLLNIANNNHPTWITLGNNTATSLRSPEYAIFQSIGEEIIKLSDTEYGFDIYIDPVTRQMNLYDDTEFEDRTDVQFGYNWGPNNISNIVIEENGGEMRNRIHVVGGDNEIWTASDDESIASNNLFEEIIQITEKTEENVLQAIANAEVAVRGKPNITYEISLKPQGPSNPYSLFEDYNIGDRIYFTVNKGIYGQDFIQLEHTARVFGASVSIDENGLETISSIQTTYSST